MLNLVFQAILFSVLPFVIGRFLMTKPTSFVRLMSSHIEVKEVDNFESTSQEIAYWVRVDPEKWAEKYPVQVKITKAMGYFCYVAAAVGLLITLADVLSLLF